MNRRPSKQQSHRPGPAPRLYWEGWWERRGFCSAGASCAPLMTAVARAPGRWLHSPARPFPPGALITQQQDETHGPGRAAPPRCCPPRGAAPRQCHASRAGDHPQQEMSLAIRACLFSALPDFVPAGGELQPGLGGDVSKALCGEPWPKGLECLLLLCVGGQRAAQGHRFSGRQRILVAIFPPSLLLLLFFLFLLSKIHILTTSQLTGRYGLI